MICKIIGKKYVWSRKQPNAIVYALYDDPEITGTATAEFFVCRQKCLSKNINLEEHYQVELSQNGRYAREFAPIS